MKTTPIIRRRRTNPIAINAVRLAALRQLAPDGFAERVRRAAACNGNTDLFLLACDGDCRIGAAAISLMPLASARYIARYLATVAPFAAGGDSDEDRETLAQIDAARTAREVANLLHDPAYLADPSRAPALIASLVLP